MPDDKAYNPSFIVLVNVTYREYVLGGASSTPVGARFRDAHNKNADPDPVTAPMVPKWAGVKPEDFNDFGCTVGCPGCDQLQIGGPVRRNHNDICHERIEAELSKTYTGKDRLGRAKDRLDAQIVEMVEEMADGPGHPKDVSHEEQQAQGEMPSASTDMEDEVLLEEGPNGTTEA